MFALHSVDTVGVDLVRQTNILNFKQAVNPRLSKTAGRKIFSVSLHW